MRLDGAVFLVQWAAGGLAFGWLTTRRREVGIGYGWLLRVVYGLFAIAGGTVLLARTGTTAETVGAVLCLAMAVAATVALAQSVVRRRAGVLHQREEKARRAARVAAMVGEHTHTAAPDDDRTFDEDAPEFDPRLDLVGPLLGVAALAVLAVDAGAPWPLAAARLVVGAAFLGCVSDAMLLGHWYLTQPGLRRDPLAEQVQWLLWLWPLEVLLFLIPTGMVQVLTGSVDDGWGGLLGWIWVVSALTTIGLAWVTRLALRERYYSAVMAATGLLYLAILTAFGTDLVARAVLSGA